MFVFDRGVEKGVLMRFVARYAAQKRGARSSVILDTVAANHLGPADAVTATCTACTIIRESIKVLCYSPFRVGALP